MDTDFNEVVRKLKNTFDGPLSKFEFEKETEEVKLTAEEKLLLRDAARKTKLGWADPTWKFETVNITRRGSRKLPLTLSSKDAKTLDTSVEWFPQQLVDAILPAGLVGYSEQNITFLTTLGQVLRAIDLPFIVGGDFNLAGQVLERARIAAPSNDTPTCLDSACNSKVIYFFVVSEELHPFVRTVANDDRQSYAFTGRLSNAGWSKAREARPKATQACQAAPVGTPICVEVLVLLRKCGQREHSDGVVRETLDEAAVQ